MNKIRKFIFFVIAMLVAMLFIAPKYALAVYEDPDLTGAIDTMVATAKANGVYAALAIVGFAIVVWLIFWAFGKLKRTAGR